jgi:hypothetical protein
MEGFNTKKFIREIIKFSPRQLAGEKKTADFLLENIRSLELTFTVQDFNISIPDIKKLSLRADGIEIDCSAPTFCSGKINDKSRIISSLISSREFQDGVNINFNPKCPAVSNSNYYQNPAFSVSHHGLKYILKARKIEGEVVVEPIKHKARNIMAGNIKNPTYILFAHYDSIKTGAIDNASGVALLMHLASQIDLSDKLVVFSACEELSYDKPIYWGGGFRAFEKEYEPLMQTAKKIIVVDCVGIGKPLVFQSDPHITELGFPVKNRHKWLDKIFIVASDFDELMEVYHSDIDDGRKITDQSLDKAYNQVLKIF